jgi:uncharacterized membrane protein YjgN (DUF898 family)
MADPSDAMRLRFGREGRPVVRAIAYDGRFGALARIIVSNALLSLVTLGLYRFWAKTRLRRYLWSHVAVDGERLEYTGRAMELLLGFLVAMIVLLLLGLVGVAINLTVDPETPPGDIIALATGILQTVLFLFLIQFAIFRARRYRLSRTQWRGIRGGQSGSAVTYGLRALAWLVANIFTLGLLYPAMRMSLQRYKIDNTWFGNQKLEFSGRARHLFGTWLAALLLALPSLGISIIWYRVREFRYWTRGVRLSGLRFKSDLGVGKVIGIVLIYIVAVVVLIAATVVIFGTGLSAIYFSLSGAEAEPQTAHVGIKSAFEIVSVASMFLVFLVFMPVLNVLLLVVPLGRAALTSTGVSGELDLTAVTQSEIAPPRRGEGFADALDVGSI